MKFCKDCIYCRPFLFIPFLPFWKDYSISTCANEKVNSDEGDFYSTGKPTRFTSIERKFGDYCGKEGKLFEGKE